MFIELYFKNSSGVMEVKFIGNINSIKLIEPIPETVESKLFYKARINGTNSKLYIKAKDYERIIHQ